MEGNKLEHVHCMLKDEMVKYVSPYIDGRGASEGGRGRGGGNENVKSGSGGVLL